MKCPECSTSFSEGAICPECGHELTLHERIPVWLGAVTVLVLSATLFFGGRALLQNIEVSAGEELTMHSDQWAKEEWPTAYYHCKEAVKAQLKAPSTAEFPFGGSRTSYLGDGQFFVEAHVDSENSFGATVRTNFSCSVVHDRTAGTWTVDGVQVE